EDGIRADLVTGVQTCALPISRLPPTMLRERKEFVSSRPCITFACSAPMHYCSATARSVKTASENGFPGQALLTNATVTTAPPVQIGRASCREREYIDSHEGLV